MIPPFSALGGQHPFRLKTHTAISRAAFPAPSLIRCSNDNAAAPQTAQRCDEAKSWTPPWVWSHTSNHPLTRDLSTVQLLNCANSRCQSRRFARSLLVLKTTSTILGYSMIQHTCPSQICSDGILGFASVLMCPQAAKRGMKQGRMTACCWMNSQVPSFRSIGDQHPHFPPRLSLIMRCIQYQLVCIFTLRVC